MFKTSLVVIFISSQQLKLTNNIYKIVIKNNYKSRITCVHQYFILKEIRIPKYNLPLVIH